MYGVDEKFYKEWLVKQGLPDDAGNRYQAELRWKEVSKQQGKSGSTGKSGVEGTEEESLALAGRMIAAGIRMRNKLWQEGKRVELPKTIGYLQKKAMRQAKKGKPSYEGLSKQQERKLKRYPVKISTVKQFVKEEGMGKLLVKHNEQDYVKNYSSLPAATRSTHAVVTRIESLEERMSKVEAMLTVVAKQHEPWKLKATAMRDAGKTAQEIADQVGKSLSTVNNYFSSVGLKKVKGGLKVFPFPEGNKGRVI